MDTPHTCHLCKEDIPDGMERRYEGQIYCDECYVTVSDIAYVEPLPEETPEPVDLEDTDDEDDDIISTGETEDA